ncbi:MAG: hypothetical protein L6Q83_05995 [Gammaproteobacteria bacterium]|nr:hypothetical protein [Gammaproteobacteria bacterium]
MVAGTALLPLLASGPVAAQNYCPAVWKQGVLDLNFNPAFTRIDTYGSPSGPSEDLMVTSFFNVLKDPTGMVVTSYFERDLVARIRSLGTLDPLTFDKDADVEELSDIGGPPVIGPPNTMNWPNDAIRVPDGVVPFEAVAVPQGFHPAIPPGRLSLINLDDPNRQEYIVHQSTGGPPGDSCDNITSKPRFYHDMVFVDMDADGLKDIATVRSSFKVAGYGSVCFFTGEIVYFKNPGPALSPTVQWEEHLLLEPSGPDIAIEAYDFENDGVPELIASSFFILNGFVKIYGAPVGQTWSVVDPVNGPFVRQGNIVGAGQGRPFNVEVVDINIDGKVDLLTTNHQPDNCFEPTLEPIPGRVNVFEQPASGNVFGGGWIRHTIKDNIRPNATFPPPTAYPGRLAPGKAKAFAPVRGLQGKVKPWIVVGGDEASKVWLLTPKSTSKTNWDYQSAVIFDINDYYGPGTTQTIMGPGGISPGEVISTVGVPSVRYDSPSSTGRAQIFIPVFEAKRIHILGLRPGSTADRVICPPDVREGCPAL